MSKIKQYFKTSAETIENLYEHSGKIELICEQIINANKSGNKILVGGNGGSCSDAEHFTGELQCTYKDRDRKPISAISLANILLSFNP